MSDFGERTGSAVVTGGTGGIGAAVCRLLSTHGCRVAFTYRSRHDAARDLSDAIGAVAAAAVDLTDSGAVHSFLTDVVARTGGIHTVVHAAGPLVPMVHLSRVPPAEYAAALAGEAVSFFTVVHQALPMLREQHGSVVAVTTAATSRYPVRDGLSAGTKGSVDALVRAFAAEEGRFGVRFNAVGPGMLVDGMASTLMESGQLDDEALAVTRRNIPLRRFGTAADIAHAVRYLASDEANFVTGQKLDIDGGYSV